MFKPWVINILPEYTPAQRKIPFTVEQFSLAAQETLTDRRLFVLDDEQWRAFQAALDSPPQEKPRLARLLTEPSIFE
ncbi:DUF1778 domain-containing protein [Scytonema sp. NUACC26]|uniref:type II toxin-antitoxin system TacA family antitoxin n=1 Tax=Scytonema sp. NUACC26 TaxID=3140176 RepID=UPI0034DC9E15